MESGFIEKRTWRSQKMDAVKFKKRRLDTCRGLGACQSWLMSSFIPILCLFLEVAATIGVDLRHTAKKSE